MKLIVLTKKKGKKLSTKCVCASNLKALKAFVPPYRRALLGPCYHSSRTKLMENLKTKQKICSKLNYFRLLLLQLAAFITIKRKGLNWNLIYEP